MNSLVQDLFSIIMIIIVATILVVLCTDRLYAPSTYCYVQGLRRGSSQGLLSPILSPRRSYGTLEYSRPIDPRRLRTALSRVPKQSFANDSSSDRHFSIDSSPFITDPSSPGGSLRTVSPRPADSRFDDISTPDVSDIRSGVPWSVVSSLQETLRMVSPRPASEGFFETMSTDHVLDTTSFVSPAASFTLVTPPPIDTRVFKYGKHKFCPSPMSPQQQAGRMGPETKAAKSPPPYGIHGDQTSLAWPFDTIDLGPTEFTPFDASTCYQVLADAEFTHSPTAYNGRGVQVQGMGAFEDQRPTERDRVKCLNHCTV